MITLATPIQIRTTLVKNRIVLPPLVICSLHPDGRVTDAVIEHYSRIAAGGCGLIIQEATCVTPEGKLAGPQLGLWHDDQIEAAKRIAEGCRRHDAVLFVQIHYASRQGEPDAVVPVGPSYYVNASGTHRALELDEVEQIRDAFIAAAVRAEKAGYHGVELHGAHGYLLCAFMNRTINRRQDRYGEPLQLVREIVQGIRQQTAPGFILTIRMGADNPDLADGLAQSRQLEQLDLDLLHVSSGMAGDRPVRAPQDFPFSDLVWRACQVRKTVSKPVIAVGQLHRPGQAEALVSGRYADMAAIGRGMLVDPEWAAKTLAGQPVIACRECRSCVWFHDHRRCPGRFGQNT